MILRVVRQAIDEASSKAADSLVATILEDLLNRMEVSSRTGEEPP
jgi:hypothetical protein